MPARLCLNQSDSKILKTAVTQKKCELLNYFLHMNIHPEELQINVILQGEAKA